MELVRYDNHVFAIKDVYGLDRFEDDDEHIIKVVLRGGEVSFDMTFDSGAEADRVFEAICDDLDVRELLEDEESDDVAAE